MNSKELFEEEHWKRNFDTEKGKVVQIRMKHIRHKNYNVCYFLVELWRDADKIIEFKVKDTRDDLIIIRR